MKPFRWAVRLGLLAAAIALIPFSGEGTDNQAQAVIEDLRPRYRPWVTSLYTPGAITEKLFFSLQAGSGAAFLGWCIGRWSTR